MPVHIPAQIRDASHSLHLTSQCKVYFADASKDVQKIADRIALSCATALEVNFNSGSIQGLDDTHLRCSLFSSLVRPVLSYGCEVWCLEWPSLFSQMNTVHNHFMKRTLHVRKSVPDGIVLCELERVPLQLHNVSDWQKTVLKYVSRLSELPS